MTTFHSNTSTQSAKFPDPERAEVLLRLGDEITEMSAHLDAGTYQLLQLIGRFDQQGGWHGTGILSSATAPALPYLLHGPGQPLDRFPVSPSPCSRVLTG